MELINEGKQIWWTEGELIKEGKSEYSGQKGSLSTIDISV